VKGRGNISIMKDNQNLGRCERKENAVYKGHMTKTSNITPGTGKRKGKIYSHR
jgi:ribosomal protein L24E